MYMSIPYRLSNELRLAEITYIIFGDELWIPKILPGTDFSCTWGGLGFRAQSR